MDVHFSGLVHTLGQLTIKLFEQRGVQVSQEKARGQMNSLKHLTIHNVKIVWKQLSMRVKGEHDSKGGAGQPRAGNLCRKPTLTFFELSIHLLHGSLGNPF